MARKQNKSVNTARKGSSVSINTKKGGKVQKKTSERNSKKRVKSQLKNTAQSQGKEIKTQPKPALPASSGKRSSRTKNDSTSNSLISASHRNSPVKSKTTKKTVTAKKTVRKQSTTKRKSNPIEQSKTKKQLSGAKSKKSNKLETSPAGKNKVVIETAVKGRKRSFALVDGDNKADANNKQKRAKTDEPTNLTSRGNRSIKQTIKGSEWKKTILQKKSTSSKQEKPAKKIKEAPVKNKSPKQNKKSLSSKLNGNTKDVSKTSTKSLKQQTKVETRNTKSASSSGKKANTTTTRNTKASKSTEAQSSYKKSVSKLKEDGRNSHKANALATSIKNKFDSCFSKKRRSRGSELQENVLVAQGIINDILNSVGTPDETSMIVDKALVDKSVELTSPDLQTSLLNVIGQKETTEGTRKTASPPQTPTSKSFRSIEGENLAIYDDNIELNKSINIDTTKLIEADQDSLLSKTMDRKSQNNLDETLEEMELRLSDTSLDDDDLTSTKNKLNASINLVKEHTMNSNSEIIDKIENGIDSKDELKIEASKELSDLAQNKNTHVNGHGPNIDCTIVSPPCYGVKESSQSNDNTNQKLHRGIKNDTSPGNKNVFLSESENDNISGSVPQNSNSVTILKKSVDKDNTCANKAIESSELEFERSKSYKLDNNAKTADKELSANTNNEGVTYEKEENKEPNSQLQQSKNGCSDSKIDLNNVTNATEDQAKSEEVSVGLTRSNCRPSEIKNQNASEFKSIKESIVDEHKGTLENGKEKEICLNEKVTSLAKDEYQSSIIDSPVINKKIEEVCKTNHKQSEPVNDNHKTVSGDENILHDICSKKIVQTSSNNTNKSQELEPSETDANLLKIYQEKKEVQSNEVTGNENLTVFQSMKNDLLTKNASKVKVFFSSEENGTEIKESDQLPINSDISYKKVTNCNDSPSNCQDTVTSQISDSVSAEPASPFVANSESNKLTPVLRVFKQNASNSIDLECEKESAIELNSPLGSEVPKEMDTSSISTRGNDFSLDQHGCTKKSNVETGSSIDMTQDVNTVTVEKTRKSHVDHCSKEEEQSNTKDLMENLNNDSKKNVSDIDTVSLVSTVSTSGNPKIDAKSENLSLTEKTVCINMPVNIKSNERMSEELSKIEEGCQKETIHETIIAGDTDIESKKCNAEIPKSSRMSVDEETPSMEVDCKEVVVSPSACSTIEIDMEVS